MTLRRFHVALGRRLHMASSCLIKDLAGHSLSAVGGRKSKDQLGVVEAAEHRVVGMAGMVKGREERVMEGRTEGLVEYRVAQRHVLWNSRQPK